MHFLQRVRAEPFPEKIVWGLKDTFAICIIPLIILNGFILEKIFGLNRDRVGPIGWPQSIAKKNIF